MNLETDVTLLAGTNPVYLTAKTAVCLMAEAGIPHADEIVQKLGIGENGSVPGIPDPEMVLGNALVQ